MDDGEQLDEETIERLKRAIAWFNSLPPIPSHEHGEASERVTDDGWTELWCSRCGLVLASESKQWENLKAEIERRDQNPRAHDLQSSHTGSTVVK